MALQALSKFMLLAPANETSLTLSVTGLNARKPEVFQVNGENLMVLQSKQVTYSVTSLICSTVLLLW